MLIVDIIGSVDDKIENNNKIIDNLYILGDYIQSTTQGEKVNCSELKFKYGKSITRNNRQKGNIDLYASNGITDKIDQITTEKNSIIFGCRGTIGNVFFAKTPCFVLNTAMYLECEEKDLGNYYFAIREKNGFKNIATGAVQEQITLDEISKTFIKFVNSNKFNTILNLIWNIQVENKKLDLLKTLYLKKFFD